MATTFSSRKARCPARAQEHALADILGQKLVASGPTQGRSVNKIQMPSHKFGKSGL
jgi:hypothetical protein